MKLLFSLTSLLILTFCSFGNGEWLYYKHYPWVWDNMTNDWLYLRGSSDGKIYSYRASTQGWEEFSVPPSALTVDLNSSVSLDMIWCPPGTFIMGSPRAKPGSVYNQIQHQVTLTNGFYLGKYEVTQAQYEAVMTGVTGDRNATPSQFHGYPNRPVETVSWNDAQVFLTRLNEQQEGRVQAGWSYVLPTEAQWEYACRAGTTTTYSWGDSITADNANYSSSSYLGQTSDVGNYGANPWGFFDMHGNVCEWTADVWNWDMEYGSEPQTDPTGPAPLAPDSHRVIRGGSWNRHGDDLRSATRGINMPRYRWFTLGFRVGLQKSL
jgi:formylglycine-generating enzyme required for sulfatase activity